MQEFLPKIVFIAVSYRTTAAAVSYARAVSSHPGAAGVEAGVVLVDNTDGPEAGQVRSALGTQLPRGLQLLDAHGNLGYFGGARVGLTCIADRGWKPDWIVVSNVDLEFPVGDLLEGLSSRDPTQYGVIAPSILSSISARDLNPYLLSRPQHWRMHLYKHLFRSYVALTAYELASTALHHVRRRAERDGSGAAPVERTIYAPHGSMMIFSAEYFRRGGTFEHEPFLFGEEISVAEYCRRAGLPVVYAPDLGVVHHEHASISRLPGRNVQGFHRAASAYCADRYFPLGGRASTL